MSAAIEDSGVPDCSLRTMTGRRRLLVVIWLFAVSVAWCFLRSGYLDWGATQLSEQTIPLWLRSLVFAAFVLPTVALLQRRDSLFWLLGLSATIGTVPQLPFLPFIHEYSHLVIVLGVIPLVAFEGFKQWTLSRFNSRIYAAYFGVCVLSTFANWAILGNVWQLKVGVAFLILSGCFAIFIIVTSEATNDRDQTFFEMLDGLIWGIFAQAVVGLATFPLLLLFQGHEGNDTVFGLAFYERYKSTFPGPVNLGMFVVVSMPLVLLWMNRRSATSWIGLAYLQLMPWLVIISGSRTARLVSVFVILSMILRTETRLRAIAMVPSVVVASYIGFFYNSFPAAIRSAFGDTESANLSFKGRFFDLSDRVGLVSQTETWLRGQDPSAPSGLVADVGTWQQMLLSIFHKVFGFGAGVGGFVQSGFPSPHMMLLNLIVDTGFVGLILFTCFSAGLLVLLLNQSLRDETASLKSWMCFVVLCSALVANATYVPHLWGFYMVTIIFSCAGLHYPVARSPAIDADLLARAASIKRALFRSVFGPAHR